MVVFVDVMVVVVVVTVSSSIDLPLRHTQRMRQLDK